MDDFIVWVCGGIDSHGVVTGHKYMNSDCDSIGHHTNEEKASGATWRWNPQEQCFMMNFRSNVRSLNQDEIFAIEDWLIKKGYKDEDNL